MSKTKVLFIDNSQSAFDILKEVFHTDDYFELVNNNAIFDEGSIIFQNREQQKNIIINLLQKENYEVILFDLSLSSRTDKNISSAMAAKDFLSIEIYNEMREWLEKNGKKFIFVTSHQDWFSERKFRSIGEIVEGAYFLRKAEDSNELYFACRYLNENQEPRCGKQFEGCSRSKCFNELLRRIVEE